MPGLLSGVARTAVVAGTATAVSNRVSRRQADRWAGQDAQDAPAYEPEPPAEAEPEPDRFERLKQLGELHKQGVLTDDEFAAPEGEAARLTQVTDAGLRTMSRQLGCVNQA